jgi:tetratricopeptide (TPR) repeat protein
MLSKFFLLFVLILSFSFNIIFSINQYQKMEKNREVTAWRSAVMMLEDANYLLALPFFENLYTAHPKEEFLKYCFGRCALYRSDKHETALKLLGEVYEKNRKVENIEYDLAKANHFNYKFDEALALLDKYLLKKNLDPDFKKKCESIKAILY